MKIPRKYYILLVAGFIMLTLYEYTKPPKINWTRTFSTYDAIPFGTEALYRLTPDLFPDKEIHRINQTFYEYSQGDSANFSVLFINQSVRFDRPSYRKLLDHVSHGNQAFLAAYDMDDQLMDTLGIEIISTSIAFNKEPYRLIIGESQALIDTIRRFPSIHQSYALEVLEDSMDRISILGHMESLPNYIKVDYGKGAFFIHTEPMAFSNYHVLKDNSYHYCENVFRQLDLQPIVWSDYPNNGKRLGNSPLRYILSQKGLRQGYFTLLTGLIFYLGLGWRRKQRPIPEMSPPVNASVDFIQTITNLYLNKKNHKVIARHRIQAFKHHLKDQLFLNWEPAYKDFAGKLGRKTGVGKEQASQLIRLIESIEQKRSVSQDELMHLNQKIEQIKES